MSDREVALKKMLFRKDGGTAYETKDEEFGFPKKYLITITPKDRDAIVKALQEKPEFTFSNAAELFEYVWNSEEFLELCGGCKVGQVTVGELMKRKILDAG